MLPVFPTAHSCMLNPVANTHLHFHRGMTGGCPNHAHYVDDKTYCTPKRLRALSESRALRGVNHRDLQEEDPAKLPRWGIEDDKIASESNFVACQLWPKGPALPKKCASVWGDPHVSACCCPDQQFRHQDLLSNPLPLRLAGIVVSAHRLLAMMGSSMNAKALASSWRRNL
jgi:hypothetical protein